MGDSLRRKVSGFVDILNFYNTLVVVLMGACNISGNTSVQDDVHIM